MHLGISKEDMFSALDGIYGALEAASSTPKATSAIKAVKVPCEPAKSLKRLNAESDAAKPSVHRENVMAPVIKAVKERANRTNRLESEVAPANIGLDSSFLENVDTDFIADYDCKVVKPSMLLSQVFYFSCVLDSCTDRRQWIIY